MNAGMIITKSPRLEPEDRLRDWFEFQNYCFMNGRSTFETVEIWEQIAEPFLNGEDPAGSDSDEEFVLNWLREKYR